MKIDALPMLTASSSGIEFQAVKPTPSFSTWLTSALSDTNQQLLAADTNLQQLARGQAVSLHHTMLTLEQAKLSFHYLEQIRNRLMTAYQDILREQI